MKLGEASVCVFLCECVWLSQLHMWPSNALGGGIHQVRSGLITYCSSLQSDFPDSLLHWEISQWLWGHFWSAPSLISPPFLLSHLLLLIYCIPQPPTPEPPSPLKMSDNGFTLIKWDSVSVPSQATGNSGSERNCLCVGEWELAHACVVIRLCVCVWVCVCGCILNCSGPDVCARVSVCDVVTSSCCLREHCRGKRERRDVLGDGWEVDHAEWKLSVSQKNCYGITEHDSLTVSLPKKENSRTWGVARKSNSLHVGALKDLTVITTSCYYSHSKVRPLIAW